MKSTDHSNRFTFSDTPTEQEVNLIRQRLEEYNREQTNGEMVIEHLWLDGRYRGLGLGRKLMLDYYLGLSKWLLPALRIAADSPAGWAIDKLESSGLSILVVLLLTLASGENLTSLYLRRGNLRLGLVVGLVVFVVVIASAIPFTLMHTGVEYTANLLIFVGMLFPLSLAWGWLLQKTDSLWGSVLFHAAMDIPIVLGLFSNLDT